MQNLSEKSLTAEGSLVEKTSERIQIARAEVPRADSVVEIRLVGDSTLRSPRFESLQHLEFTASQIRKLLQQLFPHRKLVLSQFTFFCQSGVSAPSGTQTRRGRRCFRLVDILPMAALLGVKEEGIPYKNAEGLPLLVRENAERIFQTGPGTLLAGFGKSISLRFPGEGWRGSAVEDFLDSQALPQMLFWSYDVGELARQLLLVAQEEHRYLRAA